MMKKSIIKTLRQRKKKTIKNLKREEYIKKALKENFGFFMIWGGMYFGPTAIPIISFFNTGSHLLLLGFTGYLCRDDLGTMSEAIHFVVFLSVASTCQVNCLINRRKLDNLLEAMGSGFYDYENTIDETSRKEIDEYKRVASIHKKFFAKLFIGGVVCTIIALSIIRPLLELLYLDDHKKTGDGINRLVPVDCWYPFEGFWHHLIAFGSQYLLIGMIPGIIFGTDITFLCIAEDFCVQLRAVGITLRRSKERALLHLKHEGKENEKENSPEFYRCLKKCIRHSVKHHNTINELFKDFKDLSHIILLWLMIGSTFLLCLSGILFISDKVSLLSKITFFCIICCEFVHTFIFCWYAEQIQSLSTNLGMEFYESDWLNYSKVVKYYMLNLQSRCAIPLRLSAGGFMDTNLNTFTNVLSSAYSYFNLLRAVQHPVK